MAKSPLLEKIMSKAVQPDSESIVTIGIEEAKALLGASPAKEGEDYLFKAPDGTKFKCKNNPTNRPFRKALADKYKGKMLDGVWEWNGDGNVIIDSKGHLHNCNHTLIGLVCAELERLAHVKHYQDKGVKHPITIRKLVVQLGTAKKEVIDSVDQGQKRSLGDVIFRRGEFEGDTKTVKSMANDLAGALRIVWLRMGKPAKAFDPKSATQFLEDHPKLVEAVKVVKDLNGGKGAEGQKLSSQLPLKTAAAYLYLAACIKSKVDREGNLEELSTTQFSKAKAFFKSLAEGEGLKKDEPVHTIMGELMKAGRAGKFSSAQGRNEVEGMLVKALNAYLDGEKLSAKDCKIKRRKDQETGEMVPAECPRLGGLDVEIEPPITAVKGWTTHDTCWVYDEDGAHWYGSIESFSDGEEGRMAEVLCKEDSQTYAVPVTSLSAEKPEPVEVEEEEEGEAEE